MGKTVRQEKKQGFQGKSDPFLLLISGLTLLLFWGAMDSGILNFDDNEYFSDYPEITSLSIRSLVSYFSDYYVLMYQPLSVLSMALGYALFKMDPLGHHLISLAFHLANIILVYKLVSRLHPARITARVVTFLFAVHPLAVEPVVWLSCRSGVMYTCFYLLGLLAYFNYRQNTVPKNLLLVYLWFLLSLFSKVHAVTFPLTLLVLDYFHFREPFHWKNLFGKLPFFALSLIFGFIALGNQETAENISSGLSKYNPLDYVFILGYEWIWYLVRIFIPIELSPIYVYPVKTGGLLPPEYYASLPLFGLLVWLVWKNFRRFPWLLFGLLFFYSSLIVVFQAVPSRLFVVADRYGYLPNLGVFYVCGCWVYGWLDGKISFLSSVREKINWLYLPAGVLVVITFFQKDIWKNDKTLADRIIEVNPSTPYIARAYGIRGNFFKDKENNPESAMTDYQMAAMLDSTDMISRYQMALLLQQKGDMDKAIQMFREAYRANPASPMPYTDLGVYYSSNNRHSEALACADTALRSDPYFPNALLLKAVSVLNLGQPKEAESILSLCIKKNPSFMPAYKNRGIIRINDLNDRAGACSDFTTAASMGDAESADAAKTTCPQ